jgi:hypothetical protein
MLQEAASHATHADCFDLHGYLPDLYSKFGLNPVARVKFDPAQAPAGWDEKTMDAPDVVMLARGYKGAYDMSKGYEAVKDQIPVMDYEAARAKQQEIVSKVSAARQARSEAIKSVEERVTKLAREHGFQGKVEVVDQPPRWFDVGAQSFQEAAHYQPRDRSIQVNGRVVGDQELPGLMAHEAMHDKWHRVLQEQEREHKEISDIWNTAATGDPRDDPWKRLFRASGEPRDAAAASEIEKRWPVSAMFAKTWGDSYIGTPSGRSDSRARMEAYDGVTDYSKAYWKSDRNYDTKINETLAEISRLDQEGNLRRGRVKLSPQWSELYKGINENYDRLKDKPAPSTTGPVVKEGIEDDSMSDLTPTEKEYLDEFKQKQKAFVKDTGKLGLRFDADLTGEAVPEKDMAQYIAMLAHHQHQNMLRHAKDDPGMKYGGTADFLQHEGEWFDLPDKAPQIKLMTPKECFRNASVMALENPTKYDYVEGLYVSSHLPMPIDHAWLVEKKTGKVVDPTLGWQPTSRYFGVAYDKRFLVKKMRQNEYFGVHSNGIMMSDLVLGKDKDFKYGQRDNSNNS